MALGFLGSPFTHPRRHGNRAGHLARQRLLLGGVLLSALLCATPPALAQTPLLQPLSAEDQLARDMTPLPLGQGALFVPVLSSAELEPPLLVFRDDTRVASGATGARIVLPPGDYVVYAGHGEVRHRPAVAAKVVANQTTVVEPFYTALRISAMDRDGYPVAVTYVMRDTATGEVFGPAQTAADPQRTPHPTWFVPRGAVRLALGADPNAREGVVTIPTWPGALLRYRLVVDGDTLLRTELAAGELVRRDDWLRLRWIVGGDFVFGHSRDQVSAFNGVRLQASAFSDLELGLDLGPHLLRFSMKIAESWLGLDPVLGLELPLQKVRDELALELLYSFRVARIVGLYGRGTLNTAIFPTYFYPGAAGELRTQQGETSTTRAFDADDEVQLLRAFAPLYLQSGAGLLLSPVDTDVFTFIVRAGPALRWAFFGNGRVITAEDEGLVMAQRLEDQWYAGAEGSAELGLRLGRLIAIRAVVDAFVPYQQIWKDDALRPLFRFDGLASLRLNGWASLIYNAVLHHDDAQLDKLQIMQNVSLRLQHALF